VSVDFSRALWPYYLASSNQCSYLRNKMATDLELFSFVHFTFCFHHPLHEGNTVQESSEGGTVGEYREWGLGGSQFYVLDYWKIFRLKEMQTLEPVNRYRLAISTCQSI